MRSLSDEELLERSVAGDEKALAALFERYYQTVFRFARRIRSNGTEAEDITQDVFVRLIKSIGTFNRRSEFSSWLYRVTLNAAIDCSRREERRTKLTYDFRLVANDQERPKQESSLLACQLIDIVIEFPPRERDAVLLVLAEGLSHKDAAEVIGCPLGSIGGLLNSAIKRLNRILESQEDGRRHSKKTSQQHRVATAFARC